MMSAQERLVDGMNELGRREIADREVEREANRNCAYLTILPKAGPADWSPQKGKTKSQKKKVRCMERFNLTKEKERARRTGIHVFGYIPCLGELTPERARI